MQQDKQDSLIATVRDFYMDDDKPMEKLQGLLVAYMPSVLAQIVRDYALEDEDEFDKSIMSKPDYILTLQKILLSYLQVNNQIKDMSGLLSQVTVASIDAQYTSVSMIPKRFSKQKSWGDGTLYLFSADQGKTITGFALGFRGSWSISAKHGERLQALLLKAGLQDFSKLTESQTITDEKLVNKIAAKLGLKKLSQKQLVQWLNEQTLNACTMPFGVASAWTELKKHARSFGTVSHSHEESRKLRKFTDSFAYLMDSLDRYSSADLNKALNKCLEKIDPKDLHTRVLLRWLILALQVQINVNHEKPKTNWFKASPADLAVREYSNMIMRAFIGAAEHLLAKFDSNQKVSREELLDFLGYLQGIKLLTSCKVSIEGATPITVSLSQKATYNLLNGPLANLVRQKIESALASEKLGEVKAMVTHPVVYISADKQGKIINIDSKPFVSTEPQPAAKKSSLPKTESSTSSTAPSK